MHQNYFVINYWGECWSSSNYYHFDKIKAGGKNSKPCIGPTLLETNCSDDGDHDCTACDPNSYLYEIVDPIGKYSFFRYGVFVWFVQKPKSVYDI